MASYNANIRFSVSGTTQLKEAEKAVRSLQSAMKSISNSRLNLNLNSATNASLKNLSGFVRAMNKSTSADFSNLTLPKTFTTTVSNQKGLNNITKFVNAMNRVHGKDFSGFQLPQNISTTVKVNGASELSKLKTDIQYLKRNSNLKINVTAGNGVNFTSGGGTSTRTVYIKGNRVYQDGYLKRPSSYGNNSRNGYDIYGFNADASATFQAARPMLTMNRRLSTVTEKLNNVAGRFMMAASYMGGRELSDVIIDTPARAEVQKYLLGNMQGQDATYDQASGAETSLYKTLDKTTDQLPISMQNVVQPLYAFKAASGATAQEINNIIPAFANFGAQVINMTGSEEQAEEAMQKLSRAYQGQYAAVDQYGITKESLERVGYQEGGSIEDFMKAVDEVTGDARDSMHNFNGMKQMVSKDLYRSGKHIWEGGVGQGLTGILSAFHELDSGLGGLPTEILAVGGSLLSMVTQITGATAAVGITISTFAELAASVSQARKTGGGLRGVFGHMLGGGIQEMQGKHPDPSYYSNWEGVQDVKTSTYEGTLEGTREGIIAGMDHTIDGDGTSVKDTDVIDENNKIQKETQKRNKELTEKVDKNNKTQEQLKKKTDTQNKELKKTNVKKNTSSIPDETNRNLRQQRALGNLEAFSKGEYEFDRPHKTKGYDWYNEKYMKQSRTPPSTLFNPALYADVERKRADKGSTKRKSFKALQDEISLRKKLSNSLTTGRKRITGLGAGLKQLGGAVTGSNWALMGLGVVATGAYTWIRYAAANSEKAAQSLQIFHNSLSQGFKNIVGQVGNFAKDMGLSDAGGVEGAMEATSKVLKDAGLIIQTWTGQNHRVKYNEETGQLEEMSDKEYYNWSDDTGSSTTDKEKTKQIDSVGSQAALTSGIAGFLDWASYVSTGQSWGLQEYVDVSFENTRKNIGNSNPDPNTYFDWDSTAQGNPYYFNRVIKDGTAKLYDLSNPLKMVADSAKLGSDHATALANSLKDGNIMKPFEDLSNSLGGVGDFLSGAVGDLFSGKSLGGLFAPKQAGGAVNKAYGQGEQGTGLSLPSFDLTGIQQKGQELWQSLMQGFNTGGQAGGQAGGQGGGDIGSQITQKITTSVETAKPQLHQSGAGLSQEISNGFNEGFNPSDLKIGDIASEVSSHNGEVNSAGNGLGTNVTTGFDNGLGDLSGIAGAEAGEIAQALRDHIPEVQAAANELAQAAQTGFNTQSGAIQHQSPGVLAKLMSAEGDEIVKAIYSHVTPVKGASYSLARSIVGSFNPSLDAPQANMNAPSINKPNYNNNGANGGNTIHNVFNIGSVDSKDRVKEIAEAVSYIFNFNNETAGRNTDIGMTNNLF